MIRSSLRHLRSCLSVIAGEWRMARRQRRAASIASQLAATHDPVRLHLGCGGVYKQDWINIDTYSSGDCRPDLLLDLSKPLPFADGSVRHIYSEHFFEHLPFPDAAFSHLRDCLRLLGPGGILEIGVPEPREVLVAFLNKEPHPYFDYFDRHPSVQRHLGTRMEAINWLFRQGGEHHFIYDSETLSALLAKTGFTDINPRPWNPDMDSSARREASLYMMARRPA